MRDVRPVFVAVAALLMAPAPASSRQVNECLLDTEGTLRASSTTIALGQPLTLFYEVIIPPYGCGSVSQYIVNFGRVTPRSGSVVVFPSQTGNWALQAKSGGQLKTLARVRVTVTGAPAEENGRPVVDINYDNQRDLFLRAIATPNTTVRLADDINLDLSHLGLVPIERGVHIIGGRSSTKPGPRLFTTTGARRLFMIGEYNDADNVRISGIRIDGGDMGIAPAEYEGSIGISVFSSVNVEIGNCEIYGWSGTAIEVLDAPERDRINRENAAAVWIHDNYIHHNRHFRERGYGVKAGAGAYALIERNVFDYNRHALAASHEPGTGYLAYHNLLLRNGGENWEGGPFETYTHQFDVHGSKICGGGKEAYCGHAGEYFDVRYNTLLYTRGDALKVRGYPDIRADVTQNVFTHLRFRAIVQTEGSNLYEWNNRFGTGATTRSSVCDFDSDGRLDEFMSTGVTWWYRSTAGHWNYLNTSTRDANALLFRDFNNDGRCDVFSSADGIVYNGGRAKRFAPGNDAVAQRTDLVWDQLANQYVHAWQVTNGAVQRDLSYLAPAMVYGSDPRVAATGDFNGDGFGDFVFRDPSGEVYVSALNETGQRVAGTGSRPDARGVVPLDTQVAGVGDFNGDGRSDLLWRHATGLLEIWFAGERGNSAYPTRNNSLQPIPEPLNNQVKGIGDFNGDGCSDILWRDAQGQVSIWYLQHSAVIGHIAAGGTDPNHEWEIQGVGDFDADGWSDVLWRHSQGMLYLWLKGRQAIPTWQNRPGWIVGLDWQILGVADFNADGRADILWRHTSGSYISIWHMSQESYLSEWYLDVDPSWRLRGLMPRALQTIDLDRRP